MRQQLINQILFVDSGHDIFIFDLTFIFCLSINFDPILDMW